MRDSLTDLIKQTAALFPTVLVRGDDKSTTAAAMSEDKNVIFKMAFKNPLAEFAVGESALTNLGMLNGLLNFASYNAEGSSVSAQTGKRPNGGERLESFEFKDPKGGSSFFRLTDPRMIKQEDRPPEVTKIPWELEFEPSRSGVDEFTKLASLYGEVSKDFFPRTVGKQLKFFIGQENGSTHRTSMVFQDDVTAQIKGDALYTVAGFTSIIKIAGAHPSRLHMTSRGLMMVSVETAHANYEYILRAKH